MSTCLMLHGLGPPPAHIPEVEKPYWITLAVFEEILRLAREDGTRITIDDGNATDIEIALPALLDAGLKADFFIPSDRIGTPHYVSEDGLRMLHQAGMEIGSHGCAHIRWTEVPDAAIAADVTRSTGRLGALVGKKIDTVAVPFGDCDRRVLSVLRQLGIRRVYTSFRGHCAPRGWLVYRYCITARMTPADIRATVRRHNTLACRTLTFLRTWRHVGRAALWTA